MATARIKRVGYGKYCVQRKQLFWWRTHTVPDEIGDEVCQTAGMRVCWVGSLENALAIADDIEKEGELWTPPKGS
jgi:hypothetical protein